MRSISARSPKPFSTRFAPSAARRVAMPRPMPEVEPVTRAVLPFSMTLSKLEAPDARQVGLQLVACARLVVPVELAGLLGFRELVRAVAVRLVPGQAAFAEPLLLAVDDELRGLAGGAHHDSGHDHPFDSSVRTC